MSLIRWNPMDEMERMQHEVDRLFGRLGLRGMPQLEGGRGGIVMPHVEVYTAENDVVVRANLPGLEPDDVQIEITEDAVRLTGEMKHNEEIKEDNYCRTEMQYGHFERLIPLPNRIKEDAAKATFKNGVLTVRAPLAEPVQKAKARKLSIEK